MEKNNRLMEYITSMDLDSLEQLESATNVFAILTKIIAKTKSGGEIGTKIYVIEEKTGEYSTKEYISSKYEYKKFMENGELCIDIKNQKTNGIKSITYTKGNIGTIIEYSSNFDSKQEYTHIQYDIDGNLIREAATLIEQKSENYLGSRETLGLTNGMRIATKDENGQKTFSIGGLGGLKDIWVSITEEEYISYSKQMRSTKRHKENVVLAPKEEIKDLTSANSSITQDEKTFQQPKEEMSVENMETIAYAMAIDTDILEKSFSLNYLDFVFEVLNDFKNTGMKAANKIDYKDYDLTYEASAQDGQLTINFASIEDNGPKQLTYTKSEMGTHINYAYEISSKLNNINNKTRETSTVEYDNGGQFVSAIILTEDALTGETIRKREFLGLKDGTKLFKIEFKGKTDCLLITDTERELVSRKNLTKEEYEEYRKQARIESKVIE